jgi:hypothetical protein
MNQATPIGNEKEFTFGPGAIYIETSAGFIPDGYTGAIGTGTDVGKTGPMEISLSSEYAEATDIQDGTVAVDKAVSGQRCQVSTTLKQAGLDILEKTIDGISVERDTAGVPIRYGFVKVVGERKRKSANQMTFVEMEEGKELWEDPFMIWDFFDAVSISSDTVVTIDAESFRELAVIFEVYPSEETKDHQGRDAFFLSRSKVV